MKPRTPKPFFTIYDPERSGHSGSRFKVIRICIHADQHHDIMRVRAQSSNGHDHWYGTTIETEVKYQWDTTEKLDRLKAFVRKFPIERLSLKEWIASLEKGGVVRRVYDSRMWSQEFGHYVLPKDVHGPEFKRYMATNAAGECTKAVCVATEEDAQKRIEAAYLDDISKREWGMSSQSELVDQFSDWLKRGRPVRVSEFDKFRPFEDLETALLTVDEEEAAKQANAKIAA